MFYPQSHPQFCSFLLNAASIRPLYWFETAQDSQQIQPAKGEFIVGHLIWDSGRITKQGRRELRWVLVQAARIAVNTYPHWKERYQRLARRKPANKAIARKLPVVVWHVLTECVADRKADGDGTTGQWV